MSMDLNKVTLIGNIGTITPHTFPSGEHISNVTLATTAKWKDKQTGQPKEKTSWHNLVFKKGLHNTISQYAKQGTKLYIEGYLSYSKKQITPELSTQFTNIVVTEMIMF